MQNEERKAADAATRAESEVETLTAGGETEKAAFVAELARFDESIAVQSDRSRSELDAAVSS